MDYSIFLVSAESLLFSPELDELCRTIVATAGRIFDYRMDAMRKVRAELDKRQAI